MKNKIIFIGLLSIFTAGAQAQIGKLLKKENVDASKKLVKAATLSDADMAKLSLKSVQWMDDNNPVGEEDDPYTVRLNKLVEGLDNEDGLNLNFKVYVVSDINAFATPDGSIRIMAGLMDLMEDDELRSVIGHEIGHVKLGHSKARYKSAYAISAGRDIATANTGDAGRIFSDSEMGDFMENILNAQFSQSNESESDTYGFDFMVKHSYDYHGMEGAFKKLAELSGDDGKGSLMSSHPGSAKRAEKAKERAEAQDKKQK